MPVQLIVTKCDYDMVAEGRSSPYVIRKYRIGCIALMLFIISFIIGAAAGFHYGKNDRATVAAKQHTDVIDKVAELAAEILTQMNSTISKSTRSVQNDTAIEATKKNETWRVDPETLAAYRRNPEQWLAVGTSEAMFDWNFIERGEPKFHINTSLFEGFWLVRRNKTTTRAPKATTMATVTRKADIPYIVYGQLVRSCYNPTKFNNTEVCPPVADGDMSVCYTLRNTTSLIQQESGCRTLFKKHVIAREGLICSMNHEKALKNPGTEYCVCYTTNCNKPQEQE
ncbi:unnamed protein product, partial [Mesorhabditis spiculigera]